LRAFTLKKQIGALLTGLIKRLSPLQGVTHITREKRSSKKTSALFNYSYKWGNSSLARSQITKGTIRR